MRRASLTMAMLVACFSVPAFAVTQEDDSAAHEALHERLDAQHDDAHASLREHYGALLERLRNADLRPAQKRRIYNAMTDNLSERHDGVHDRLRRIHRRAHDRPTDVRRDVRRDVRVDRPAARPSDRPGAPRLGTPGRTPVEAQRGLRVARIAARR